MKNAVTRVAGLVVVISCFFLAPAFAASVDLSTPSGPIRGVSENGISAYKGIPYAKPPVGELRFAPPQDVVPWTNTLDCTNFGPIAMQQKPRYNLPMSEDCLTLNIWTPEGSGDKLPVYVFIHGGGFANGSGADPVCDGTNFARQGIVTVTINYRLNALGFYATQEIFDRYGTAGNQGLLDQVKALEWIRDNIAAFGGDPSKVTIGGESAGSYSVGALILNPLAEGLFRGAIMESGTILSIAGNSYYAKGDLKRSIEVCNMISAVFGAGDGAEGLAKLRTADAEVLAQLTPLDINFIRTPAFFCLPVYDGKTLPRDPVKALKEGRFNKVKLLCGYNSDEGSIFIPAGTTEQEYKMLANRMFGSEKAASVLARFPVDAAHSSTDRARQIQAFGMFSNDIKVYSDIFAQYGLDVYAYQFAYVSPENAAAGLGASHGSELGYTFRNPAVGSSYSAVQATLADNMHLRWVNFIKNGDPNVGDTPPSPVAWPKYDAQNAMMMRFDETLSAGAMENKADMAFMQDIMFGDDPYYPVEPSSSDVVVSQTSGTSGCYTGAAGVAALAAAAFLAFHMCSR